MKAVLATTLPTCKLCQNKPANQTGSHIFNSSLIKGAVNADGETKRDKEISHTIRPGVGVETYFGRHLSISKVEETLGREMSEQEAEANVNPYTVDHLVCSDCEKRIERVENYFMTKVYDKLEKDRLPTENINKDIKMAKCDGVDEKLIRLYFYTLAWRAAETNFGNINFEKSDKEFLRKVLNENLDLDIKNIVANAENNKKEVCELPLVINYLTTTENSSENFIYAGKSKRPYFFLLNDISFQLFFNEKWVKSHNEFLWGLFRFQKVKELVNIGSGKMINIGVVSEDFRKNVILYNITRCLADIEVKSILKDFSEVHQMLFGDKPTRQDVADLFKEYTDDTIPMGVRYAIERKSSVFAKKIIDIAKRRGFAVDE